MADVQVGGRADDHAVKPLRLQRRRHVGEPGHLVLLRDLLQQRRIGFAGKHLCPPGPLETAQMPLPDAAAADNENLGFHPRHYNLWQADNASVEKPKAKKREDRRWKRAYPVC